MDKPRVIFLTGATGVLGRELLKEILNRTQDEIIILVRRKKNQSHWARARKQLEMAGQDGLLGTRVHVVAGDVSFSNLGLSELDIEFLQSKVTHFFHVAALTTLNASREDSSLVNTYGTEQALQIAWKMRRQGKLERFYYFSTAYASGSRQTFCALEDELPSEPAFANFYESSKYEAEKRVRAALAEGLPVTIFRPSIVVGDSKTGEVGEFNVIYPFIKLFAHGVLKKLPTHLDNSFNIVPIDFVIKASLYIAGLSQSIGKTYHLVTQNPPAIGTFLKVTQEEYPAMPAVEVVSPESFEKSSLNLKERNVYGILEPYLGYLNDHLTFDTANTEEVLTGSGIDFPNTDSSFLKTICQYAVDQGYLLIQS